MKFLIVISILFCAVRGNAYEPGTPVTPKDTLKTDCDTLWLKSGGIRIVTILSDNGQDIKFTECPPTEIVSTIPKSATKLSPRDSALAAKRATECDTIFMKGGEIITGHMKYYNSRKVVYTGCCMNCITEKIVKRKFVDSIHYVNGKVVKNGSTYVPPTTNEPEEKEPEPEVVYTEREKEKFKKRSKLWGWLSLGSLALGLTAALLVIILTTVAIEITMLLGIAFFALLITAAVFGFYYFRNRKKAGLRKKK